nr:type II toxin-antitoxin system VapC family toxin [Serratia marcescens]
MKRLLLDTHALLWWLIHDACLGVNAKRQIADPGNAVYVSAASIWEISIKQALGKLALPEDIFAINRGRGFSVVADGRLSLPTGRAAAAPSSRSF